MKKYIPIIFLVILTTIVRFYGFHNPVADWHSWRQVDTAAVSRTFVEKGFDIIHPRYHDLSNVASGKDNPSGYRFVEFPIYNILQAGGYILFSVFTLEEWGRLITIIASCFSTLFLYLIVKAYSDKTTAFLAGLFFALLPFNIYYGRVILPDPSMVATTLAGIYFFIRSEQQKHAFNSDWFFALFFITVAFLVRPYALFFVLPLFTIAWQKYGFSILTKKHIWVFVLLSILPLLMWRNWMTQFPEGIPVNEWLFNGGNIRFKGAFFYWLFADRLGRLILGYWGMGLLFLGLLGDPENTKKERMFFSSFLVSSLLYLCVIARGNVQHDYYQILIVPTICIFLAVGAKRLITATYENGKIWKQRLLFFIATLFMLVFGWYFIRDYYNINNPVILTAGNAVATLTPKTAKVIAPYDGDTTLLYYTKRQGWASFQNPLPELIKKGATHLLLLHPSEKDMELAKQYTVVKKTDEYVIFALQ